jgi:DcmR-like sensory protein
MPGSNMYQVYEILDSMQDCNHSVIFYEEPEYGRMVEYRFIKIGLLKGESCIYATPEDDIDIIESGMVDFGIDVEGYKKMKMLHLYKVTDPQGDPSGLLHGIEKISERIIAESRPPFRVVGRFIKNFEEEVGMRANMLIERSLHSTFAKFQGSFMCPYPINDIHEAMEGAWMQNHLRNHHTAIFVFKDGHGLALNLP